MSVTDLSFSNLMLGIVGHPPYLRERLRSSKTARNGDGKFSIKMGG